jgi:hypothetical protein
MEGSKHMLVSTEGRQKAYDKLNALVEKGRAKASQVIEHVMTNQPQDRIVKGSALTFQPTTTGVGVTLPEFHGNTVDLRIHRHALNQMALAVDMPMKFLDSLADEKSAWGKELLAHNLNTIYHERHSKKRNLARAVNGEVRGFLSDQYRRLDSRPIIEAFASVVQDKGALPYEGIVTDTKIAIQALMPQVYEPVPGELVAYGLSLENSDFGNGALSLRAYLLRIYCENLAITEETMRQIHLGKRLDDNMLYSQRTYELDSKTTVSALRDVINVQLDHDSLTNRMNAVRTASDKEVSVVEARERLKKVLNKTEAEAALNAYESKDVYNLPEGNSVWRLSNAISWIAGREENAERKLDLMRIAGEVLPKAA